MGRMLPFSRDVFFSLFETYNLAIWPAQAVAYVLAIAALGMVLRPFHGSGRLVAALLALAWTWNGIAYHLLFFAPINFWAYGFALLFVLQGLLFALAAMRGRPEWRFRRDASGFTQAVQRVHAHEGPVVIFSQGAFRAKKIARGLSAPGGDLWMSGSSC